MTGGTQRFSPRVRSLAHRVMEPPPKRPLEPGPQRFGHQWTLPWDGWAGWRCSAAAEGLEPPCFRIRGTRLRKVVPHPRCKLPAVATVLISTYLGTNSDGALGSDARGSLAQTGDLQGKTSASCQASCPNRYYRSTPLCRSGVYRRLIQCTTGSDRITFRERAGGIDTLGVNDPCRTRRLDWGSPTGISS